MNNYSDYNTHELFLQLLNTTTKQTRHIKHKKHKIVWDFLVTLTSFLPGDVPAIQRIWHIHNDTRSIPVCKMCGNVCNWSTKNQRYNFHCSNKCRAIDPDVESKRSTTCINRYGEDKHFTNNNHLALTRATCLSNHGVEFPLQHQSIKDKTNEALIQHYGTNAMDAIRAKGQHTLREKYGNVAFGSMFTNHSFQQKRRSTSILRWLPTRLSEMQDIVIPMFSIDEYVNCQQKMKWTCVKCSTVFDDNLMDGQIPRCPTCYPLNRTFWNQQELVNFVRELDPTIVESTRIIIKPKELDIYSSAYKIGIEYNGLYWHSDANKDNASVYHLSKSDDCTNQNIRLIHIFEDQWKNKRPIVESIIRNAFGKTQQRIAARQCKIVQLTYAESSTFLNSNHIQGEDKAPIRYGLMHGDKLVYVMTFGKSRFDKTHEFELYRAAAALNTTVMGGAARLFKHFVSSHNPTSIVTYSDKSLFSGSVYQKLGFEKQADTPPAYSYVSIKEGCNRRYSRFKFQKHKLAKLLPVFDPLLSEDQNMKANNYAKIWDCGNSKWIWNRE